MKQTILHSHFILIYLCINLTTDLYVLGVYNGLFAREAILTTEVVNNTTFWCISVSWMFIICRIYQIYYIDNKSKCDRQGM